MKCSPTLASVILLLVAGDPRSEFRADQFICAYCSREMRRAGALGKCQKRHQDSHGTPLFHRNGAPGSDVDWVGWQLSENDMTNQNNQTSQNDKHKTQPQAGQQTGQQQKQGGQQSDKQNADQKNDQQRDKQR